TSTLPTPGSRRTATVVEVEVGVEPEALDALAPLPVPPQAAIVMAAAIGTPSVISRFIRSLL
ncbi:MAG TPA: hypothetical protein VGH24_02435, partial [Solirubrobacteraceae bacterium]